MDTLGISGYRHSCSTVSPMNKYSWPRHWLSQNIKGLLVEGVRAANNANLSLQLLPTESWHGQVVEVLSDRRHRALKVTGSRCK